MCLCSTFLQFLLAFVTLWTEHDEQHLYFMCYYGPASTLHMWIWYCGDAFGTGVLEDLLLIFVLGCRGEELCILVGLKDADLESKLRLLPLFHLTQRQTYLQPIIQVSSTANQAANIFVVLVLICHRAAAAAVCVGSSELLQYSSHL